MLETAVDLIVTRMRNRGNDSHRDLGVPLIDAAGGQENETTVCKQRFKRPATEL